MNDLKLAKKYLRTYQSAQDRGLTFTLSFMTYKNVMSRKCCPYSGVVMNEDEGSPRQRTLDRIDASMGYIAPNVIACSSEMNSKKTNLTAKEIEVLYKVIRKRRIT